MDRYILFSGTRLGKEEYPLQHNGEKVLAPQSYFPDDGVWQGGGGYTYSPCQRSSDPNCVPYFLFDRYADAPEGFSGGNLFCNLHPEYFNYWDNGMNRDFTETYTFTVQPASNSPNLRLRLIVPDDSADTPSNPYRTLRNRPTTTTPIIRAVNTLPVQNAQSNLRKMTLNNLYFPRKIAFNAPISPETSDDCLPKRMWFHLYSLEGNVDVEMTCRRVGEGYASERVDHISGEVENTVIPPTWDMGLQLGFSVTGAFLFRGPTFNQALYNAPCDQMLMLELETENGDCGELEFTYWQGESLPVEAVRQNPAAGIRPGPEFARPELASDPMQPHQKPQVK